MGEIAEDMLNGVLCERCTAYIGENVGYPRLCHGCKSEERERKNYAVVEEAIDYLSTYTFTKIIRRNEYHISFISDTGRVDVYPKKLKYHDVTNNARGVIEPGDMMGIIEKIFSLINPELNIKNTFYYNEIDREYKSENYPPENSPNESAVSSKPLKEMYKHAGTTHTDLTWIDDNEEKVKKIFLFYGGFLIGMFVTLIMIFILG